MKAFSDRLSDVKISSNSCTSVVKISVCAATFKRPDLLQNLLESLNKLTFVRSPKPDIEVIIVDNDSAGSAQSIVEAMKASFQWKLKYFIETNQGVTYARNRCISEAASDRDFIAILDDDEIAVSQWLEELLITQQAFEADIVVGPVLATFQDNQDVPSWMESGDFHSYPRYKTGQRLETGYTGNVMLSTKITKRLKEGETLFDNRFAQNGAEDAYLFACLYKEGFKMVWADDAVLYEPVAEQRLSLQWILKRGFWSWSVHSFIESELYPSLKIQAIRAMKGCALISLGIVGVGPSILLGKAKVARSLLRIYRGMGTLSGLLGRQGSWQ